MKNIALIGFGKIGKKFFNLSLKKKDILINKILKRKISNIKILNVKFFRNFKSLAKNSNIDGYIVATPVSSHYEYARKIINKKKPFIIEKPLVANLQELKKLYILSKNYKHSIFVNHSDLYNPAFLIFLKNLKSVGKYKKINISFGKFQKINKFNINDKKKYFLPSFDWLPHALAIAIKLAGLPKKISIIKNNIFIKKKYIFQKCNICLHCKKKIVNINFSNRYQTPKKRIFVKGSNATLVYDGYKKNVLIRKNSNKFFTKFFHSKIDPFENLLKLFYFSLTKKYKKNDIHFAYKIMKILFKIENEMKNKLKFSK